MLLILLFSIYNYSQVVPVTNNPLNAPFVGTWEHNLNGNQVFRLIIWEDTVPNPYDNEYYLEGHYELVEISGNTETVIYTSNPSDVPVNLKFPIAFSGDAILQENGSYIFGGRFHENHQGGTYMYGWFSVERISSCLGCPPKIRWKIERAKGIRAFPTGSTIPTTFIVPNNIELTKVN